MLSISGLRAHRATRPATRPTRRTSATTSGSASAWGHTHGYHFDYVAGYHGALGVLAALRQTAATGHGVHLDLAQVEAGAGAMMPILVEHLATGATYERRDNHVPDSVLAAVVRCAGDDRWLAVEAVDLADWERLCAAIEHRPPAGTPGPDDVAAATGALAAWAGERSAYQAAHLLQRAGVAAAPVQDAADLARDPQLRSRGFIVELDHRDLGRIEYPGAIERTVRPSGGVKGPVPRLGEHTREVLGEWAGIDDAEIGELAARGRDLAPRLTGRRPSATCG